MKILPCKHCKAPALAARRPEILQTAGTLHDPITRYSCVRCGRAQTITTIEFASLPEMTPEEIAADNCDITIPPDEILHDKAHDAAIADERERQRALPQPEPPVAAPPLSRSHRKR